MTKCLNTFDLIDTSLMGIKRFKNLSRILTGNTQTINSAEHIRRTTRVRYPEIPSFLKMSRSFSNIKHVKYRPIAKLLSDYFFKLMLG